MVLKKLRQKLSRKKASTKAPEQEAAPKPEEVHTVEDSREEEEEEPAPTPVPEEKPEEPKDEVEEEPETREVDSVKEAESAEGEASKWNCCGITVA